MYTIQENVLIVIALLKEFGINKIVINPGGTNIPIVQAIQNDPYFKCYSVPDERSAIYFAIGLYLQSGEIIATSCTSAQATRNYIPGLTEAFYKHVPILAITTSKLERYDFQEYMQAPIQCSLPTDSVKRTFDLPLITDENSRSLCMNRAKSAFLELMHRVPGPIQLNIRINDKFQGEFENKSLPSINMTRRYMAWDDWEGLNLSGKRVLVIIGEHRVFSSRQKNALEGFCSKNNAVVYTNHLSNYQGDYSLQGNLLVSCGYFKELKPDVVISIGGQTGDYSLFGVLSRSSGYEHWRVSEEGDLVDTYNCLTKIFECPDFFFFEKIGGNDACDHNYFNSWLNAYRKLNLEDIILPFSNIYVAQKLYSLIPKNSIMNFAILNSLRCWNYFPLDSSISCYANVGAFGIDGCNSMLFGESVNTDNLCFIVTGDLAFFYDMNALGIRHLKNNIRVLLINNNGGVEFKIMTQNWNFDLDVEKYVSANGHNGNARGWAENCGFEYIYANNKEQFDLQQEKFLENNSKPILFEIFTSYVDEPKAINDFLNANMLVSSKSRVKNALKSLIGK